MDRLNSRCSWGHDYLSWSWRMAGSPWSVQEPAGYHTKGGSDRSSTDHVDLDIKWKLAAITAIFFPKQNPWGRENRSRRVSAIWGWHFHAISAMFWGEWATSWFLDLYCSNHCLRNGSPVAAGWSLGIEDRVRNIIIRTQNIVFWLGRSSGRFINVQLYTPVLWKLTNHFISLCHSF